MFTAGQLEKFRGVDMGTVDKAALVDIGSLCLDPAVSYQDRICKFTSRVANPYVFRVGDVAVKFEYSREGVPLQDALKSYLGKISN